MTALANWIPRLIIATALLHFVWTFAQPHDWDGIVRDGVFMTNGELGAGDHRRPRPAGLPSPVQTS